MPFLGQDKFITIRDYQDLCRGLMYPVRSSRELPSKKLSPGGETGCYAMWTSFGTPNAF